MITFSCCLFDVCKVDLRRPSYYFVLHPFYHLFLLSFYYFFLHPFYHFFLLPSCHFFLHP
jgi:hypothetical protein